MKFYSPLLALAAASSIFMPAFASPVAEPAAMALPEPAALALPEPNNMLVARGLFDGTKSVSIAVALQLVIELTTKVTGIEAQINATVSALGKTPSASQKAAAIVTVGVYINEITLAITNTTGVLGLAANGQVSITTTGQPTLQTLAQAIIAFLTALIATINSALSVLGMGLAGIVTALIGAINGLLCVLVTLVSGLLPVLTKLLNGIFTALVGILKGLIL